MMPNTKNMFHLSVTVLVVAVIYSLWIISPMVPPFCNITSKSDRAKWRYYHETANKEQYPFKNDGITTLSHYVTMRDGVKIAASVYLPTGALKKGIQLPTLLHGTRYLREVGIQFPFSLLLGKAFNVRRYLFDPLILHGYAIVSFDVRGTGASGGFRKYDMADDEVKDISEIIDWILKQDWSDGQNLGSFGISYEGLISEVALSTGHPAVKAIAPFFSPLDLYRDLGYVGGVFSSNFFKIYGSFVANLERGLPIEDSCASLGAYVFLNHIASGPAPVSDSKEDKEYLQQAIREHDKNWLVQEKMVEASYSDKPLLFLRNETIDSLSLKQLKINLKRKDVGVLGLSSWYDGAFVQSTITRHLSMQTPYKRLILGPWGHGGHWNASPYSGTKRVCFNYWKELIDFFDFHLKHVPNGYYDQSNASVTYYTVGKEEWQTSATWPPRDSQSMKLYLADHNMLSEHRMNETKWHTYKVDFTVETDKLSRWNLLMHMHHNSLQYRSLKHSNSKRLVFSTEDLLSDVEITGHPSLFLNFSADNNDTVIFAYLMDYDPQTDSVRYITEGHLRAIHRKESNSGLLKTSYMYRSFCEKDIMPLTPGNAETMHIYFMPVSYQIKEGHKILLAISGSDIDNFDLSAYQYSLATKISINLKETYLNLPVRM